MKKQNKCEQNESLVTLFGVLYWAMEIKGKETIRRAGSSSSSKGRKVSLQDVHTVCVLSHLFIH
jgi:hypothetical protein